MHKQISNHFMIVVLMRVVCVKIFRDIIKHSTVVLAEYHSFKRK